MQTNFNAIKEQLIDKITKVQKSTAEKVVKRIYRKIIPCDAWTQTAHDSAEEELKHLRELENDLYRQRHYLREENKAMRTELGKAKTSWDTLQSSLNKANKEIEALQKKVGKPQDPAKNKDSENLIKARNKIKQYKDIIDKRDTQMQQIVEEK